MRAYIVLIIVIGICLYGLIKPKVALYGYIWFGLMRPDYLAYAPGRYGLSTLLAVVTLATAFRHILNVRLLAKPIPIMLILFQCVIALSANNAILPAYAWTEFARYMRMMLMCLVIPVVITTEEDFRELFLVTTVSLGFLGFWWGLTAGVRGSRIVSGPGGFMADNNTFAVAVAMIVPFCWHARSLVKQPWAKAIFGALLMGSVVTIILTFSRGAAIATALGLFLLIVRSKRRAIALTMVGLAVVPILAVMGTAYKRRLSTLQTYEQDGSVMSRLQQMRIAYELWRQHPMLGIGIGDLNYLTASRPYLSEDDEKVIVHNSFLQTLVHTGIFGFTLFVAALLYALWICWRTGWQRWKTEPQRAVMPLAIFVSLMIYSIASMFHPRAWFDFLYMLLVYSSAWSEIAKRRPKAQAGSAMAAPSSRAIPPARRPQWNLPQQLPAPARRG